MTSAESICALAPGDESKAAGALGGAFVLEPCGFFGKCDHRVERWDLNLSFNHVEMWYCSTDFVKVGVCLFAGLVVVFLLWKFIRRRARGLVTGGGGGE